MNFRVGGSVGTEGRAIMMPPRLEMLVVALAAAGFYYQRTLGGSSGAATTIDGITFPAELQASGTKQLLCGGGTRLKYNVVKVYAVGLYFEPQAVTRGGGADSLKQFVGMKAIPNSTVPSLSTARPAMRVGRTNLRVEVCGANNTRKRIPPEPCRSSPSFSVLHSFFNSIITKNVS